MVAVRRGTSGGPEHERAVVAAEAERVVHRVAQAARPRVVEMYLRAVGRVPDLSVQRARQQAVFERDQREHRFDDAGRAQGAAGPRSEEHTSELQSLMRISYAVFCWKK